MNRSTNPALHRPTPAGPVLLIAIAGGSGSGKTWLATALRRRLHPRAGLISIDDFYRDMSHLPPARRAARNFDAPRTIDWACFEATLREIAAGGTPLLPRYDFARHVRSPRPRHWRRRPIVIIEGLWPWVQAAARGLFALRIYRDVAADVRFARRLRRDVKFRGRTAASVERQWSTQVEPMHERHVAPQRASADIVLDARLSPRLLDQLAARIRRLRPARAN